jgi:hypothetical protein
MPIKKANNNTFVVLGAIGALLTSLIAVLTYNSTKEHRELQKTNAKLDQELKLLELEQKKSQLKKNNPQ